MRTGSAPDGELSLLVECGSDIEASSVRSLLQAHDIPCVIQAEHHRGLLGGAGALLFDIRVLVPTEQLEKAVELLSAEPDESAGEELPSDDSARRLEAGEAVCDSHGLRADSTCARCGAFTCECCGALEGKTRLCVLCVDASLPSDADRAQRRRRIGVGLLAVLWGPGLVVTALTALWLLLR